MPDLNRVVAGLSCRDVLEDLSEFVDGALPRERVALIRSHLAECDTCERFGGRFSAIVAEVRRHETDASEREVFARLRARLRDQP